MNNGNKSTAYYEKVSPTLQIGIRGLKNLAGRVNEEYLSSLKSWEKESKIYLEMIDDIIVGTLLDSIILPLLQAKISVEAASEHNKVDEYAANWLYDCINNMDKQTWSNHVSDMLESLCFGFAIGEIVFEKRADGKLWLKNIDPRGQETLHEWVFGEGFERDKALAFVQRDPDSGELMKIPLSKCVHVAYRGRKGNPQGKSILRSIFRTWRMCRDLENIEAIGIERDVGGMPIATLPEGNISETDVTTLKDFLKSLRIDEALYGIVPSGVEINAYGGGNKMYDVATVIERKQKEILGRFFAQFLKLGMEKVGTQALVKGSHDFFMLGLRSIQNCLLEVWNQQLVPYIFTFNTFPGISGLPKIAWEEPGKYDYAGLLNALNIAVSSKLYTPTDVDEEHIRQLMDMPELPESEKGFPRTPEVPPLGSQIEGGFKKLEGLISKKGT